MVCECVITIVKALECVGMVCVCVDGVCGCVITIVKALECVAMVCGDGV